MADAIPTPAGDPGATLSPDPIPLFCGLPVDIEDRVHESLLHIVALADLVQGASDFYDAPGIWFLGDAMRLGVDQIRAHLMIGGGNAR
ncbi:MAG: hypothetical protein RLY86_146 [Pseudomonadota bacterium]|jgi:hypothetical protein